MPHDPELTAAEPPHDGAPVSSLGLLPRAAQLGEWLHQAIDVTGRGVTICDLDGRMVFANQVAQHLLRVPADKLQGADAADPRWRFERPDGSPVPRNEMPLARCVATDQPVTGEVLGLHDGTGHLRWQRIDAHPLHDDDGTLAGVVLVFDDVTETMHLERELMRSEQQLTEARRAGRVGLWEWDAETGKVWHDEHFELVTGLRFTGDVRGWFDAVHPDDHAMLRQSYDQLLDGADQELTYRVILTDGTTRWVRSHSSVVARDGDGRSLQVAGSVVDVSDAHAVAAELRTLLDSMADGYYVLRADWTFGFLNRAAEEILGRSDLIGQVIWDAFPGVDEVLRQPYQRAFAGETVELETYYAGLDGWYEIRATPLGTDIAVCFRDVTERHRVTEERERLLARANTASARLAHAAAHDALTGLPNRWALMDWLRTRTAPEGDGERVGLLYLDLDRFKLVNDTYGHRTGDVLLVHAARRLEAAVRPEELVARLGGDEFVVAVTDTTPDELQRIAQRILRTFRDPFAIDGRRLVVTTSIGLALGRPSATGDSLVRDADAALYRAKDAGRDGVGTFDESLRQSAWRRLATETDLRDALVRPATAIQAHFQPIYHLSTGEVLGAEALARWFHPERGRLAPAEFIPVAEETGLIVDLGWLMLDTAGDALDVLGDTCVSPDRRVWVNVAARQLDEPGFADQLLAWAEHRRVVGQIVLEITESALTRNIPVAHTALRRFAEHGFAIAIDDFGTGFSSMSRLAGFPVDVLKIDRSFTVAIDSPTGRGIVSSIVSLAHSIGATACAEGVEEASQLEVLGDLGVDSVSGFHLCPPVPLDAFATAADQGRHRILTARV